MKLLEVRDPRNFLEKIIWINREFTCIFSKRWMKRFDFEQQENQIKVSFCREDFRHPEDEKEIADNICLVTLQLEDDEDFKFRSSSRREWGSVVYFTMLRQEIKPAQILYQRKK